MPKANSQSTIGFGGTPSEKSTTKKRTTKIITKKRTTKIITKKRKLYIIHQIHSTKKGGGGKKRKLHKLQQIYSTKKGGKKRKLHKLQQIYSTKKGGKKRREARNGNRSTPGNHDRVLSTSRIRGRHTV